MATLTKRQLDEYLQRGGTIHFPNNPSQDTEPEPTKHTPLGSKAQDQAMLADPGGTLLVRITRHVYRGRLDGDNMQGGCKQLRDTIAAAFGRKGDSERDGFRWEYCQSQGTAEKGEAFTQVEIWKVEE